MGIDTKALSRIFNNTTNSYKYLFFISLLELLRNKEFNSIKISYRELSSMMLAYAWYPKTYFRLSFGKQDQVGKYLESIDLPRKLTPIGTLYSKILSNENLALDALLSYVPQRLIREFFLHEMAGKKDSLVDSMIVNLSCERINNSSPPLYKIDQKSQTIELANVWLNFLKNNFNPMLGWCLWHWAMYLQKHNPSSPAIISKLIPPKTRASLTKQKLMWDNLIHATEIRCIYTNEKIQKNYHLDHFLPWSFVAHNQPWNLIPTSPEVNLSKSDSIPKEIYVPALAGLQHKMLLNSRELLTDKKWLSEVIPYVDALHVDQHESLLKLEQLENYYLKTYKPLIEIAKNSGFPGDWAMN
jgi:hypothetical protein